MFPIPAQAKRTIGWKGWLGAGLGLVLLTACSNGSTGEPGASSMPPAPIISTQEPAASPSAEAAALLEDFEGKACDGDELVMDQGTESLYCDVDSSGALLWVSAATHKTLLADAEAKALAKAKSEAEEKAVAAALKQTEEAAAAAKKEITLKKPEAVKQDAAAPSARGFVAPKPTPKVTPKPTPKPTPKATPKPTPKSGGSAFYKNCTAVRNAGAAPIYKGQPGYSRKLDRDGDGVACE